MERLLKDAQELTGVEYNIDNLGDVYSAIHAIQGSLGLTGVAADEAKTTLTGTLGAMKASWTNLLAALTTGEGLDAAMQNLTTSVSSFATVALEMFGNLMTQVPTLLSGLAGAFIEAAPELLASGVELIAQLITGFLNGIPTFLENVPVFAGQVSDAMGEIDWASMGKAIIDGIIAGVKAAASALWEAVQSAAGAALNWAKGVLGINSPSKVFADEVGRWIPEGMAVGIEANLSPVNESIRGMANTASVELQRAKAPGATWQPQLPSAALAEDKPQTQPVFVVRFDGELAQLGRILQPYIVQEGQRRGTAFVT